MISALYEIMFSNNNNNNNNDNNNNINKTLFIDLKKQTIYRFKNMKY